MQKKNLMEPGDLVDSEKGPGRVWSPFLAWGVTVPVFLKIRWLNLRTWGLERFHQRIIYSWLRDPHSLYSPTRKTPYLPSFRQFSQTGALLNLSPRSFFPRSLRGEEDTSDQVTLHHSPRTLLLPTFWTSNYLRDMELISEEYRSMDSSPLPFEWSLGPR